MHSKKGNNLNAQKSNKKSSKKVLVTAGTFRFDALIEKITQPAVLTTLREKYSVEKIILQCGNRTKGLKKKHKTEYGIEVERVAYIDGIEETFLQYDLVICHGGAGTVIELIRSSIPFIVIPNQELSDGHQAEFCMKLLEMKLIKTIDVNELPAYISEKNVLEEPNLLDLAINSCEIDHFLQNLGS